MKFLAAVLAFLTVSLLTGWVPLMGLLGVFAAGLLAGYLVGSAKRGVLAAILGLVLWWLAVLAITAIVAGSAAGMVAGPPAGLAVAALSVSVAGLALLSAALLYLASAVAGGAIGGKISEKTGKR